MLRGSGRLVGGALTRVVSARAVQQQQCGAFAPPALGARVSQFASVLGARSMGGGPPSAAAASLTEISRKDLMSLDEYEKVRKEWTTKFRAPTKKLRRVALGPSASMLFTNYDLIWFQTQEMLRIEKGGEEQIGDELEAYRDLIPKKGEICGCLMYEVDNEVARRKFLESMVGSEHDTRLCFAGQEVAGKPIHDDIDRTHPDGRTSAVHFLRFSLTPEQVEAFSKAGSVVLKMAHASYPHMTELSGELVASIGEHL